MMLQPKTQKFCVLVLSSLLFGLPVSPVSAQAAPKNIYYTGWIDFNKNGRKDVYEDSRAGLNARIENLLSQMTLEEKTCQTATLYGYNRVLKDELPTAAWKSRIWKDGIANIDEHLNGWGQGASS